MKIESVNRSCKRTALWVLRHRWLVLVAFAGLIVFSAVGTKRIVMKTSFDDYFLEDAPVLVKTNEFKSIFGNDYYAAVLVKNKDIFSHRSLSLIRELSNELLDSLSYAEKLTSLTDLEFTVGTDEGMTIEQIVPEDIPTAPSELAAIKQRAYSKPHLARKLVSKDGTMTWIMVKLRTFPPEEEWKKTSDTSPDILTGKELAHIINKPKYRELSPNASGMPYLAHEKVAFLQGEMGRLMLFALIASIVVMLLVTRSWRGVVAPLLTSVVGILLGYGVIWCIVM